MGFLLLICRIRCELGYLFGRKNSTILLAGNLPVMNFESSPMPHPTFMFSLAVICFQSSKQFANSKPNCKYKYRRPSGFTMSPISLTAFEKTNCCPMCFKYKNEIAYNNIPIAQHSMYYFLFPSFTVPQDLSGLVSCCQVSTSEVNKQQNEKEKSKLGFQPQMHSGTATIAKEIRTIIISRCQLKSRKQVQKPNNSLNDEDYIPEIFSSNNSKKMPKLENRNVVPNAIRHILSFIQKRQKSEAIAEKLLQAQGVQGNWSVKRFYLYQGIVKSKLNNYVNEDTIKKLVRLHPESYQMLSRDEQLFYNKITRVLIHYYLRDQFLCSVLTSSRMDKTKTNLHLAVFRRIRNNLNALLGEQTHSL